MDYSAYAKKYIERRQQSESCVARLLRGGFSSPEQLHPLLHRFVLEKYLLDDVEETNLGALARMSVEQLLARGQRHDNPSTCEGTTSAMNKKVLLLMALQRELGVSFPVEVTAYMETTMDIAREVFKLLSRKEGASYEP